MDTRRIVKTIATHTVAGLVGAAIAYTETDRRVTRVFNQLEHMVTPYATAWTRQFMEEGKDQT